MHNLSTAPASERACSFPGFCSAVMLVARIWSTGTDPCCPGQAKAGPRSGAGTGNSVMHQSLAGGDAVGRGGHPSLQPDPTHRVRRPRPGIIQRLEQWQRQWQQQCPRQSQQRFGPIRWAADRSQSAWIDYQRRQGIHVVPAAGNPDSVPTPRFDLGVSCSCCAFDTSGFSG